MHFVILNAVVMSAALTWLVDIRYVGGLVFFRLGRFGGSFYVSKKG